MDRPRVLRPCLLHAGAPETPVQVEGTWEPALHFRRKCPPLVHCLVQVQLLPPGASTPPPRRKTAGAAMGAVEGAAGSGWESSNRGSPAAVRDPGRPK